MHCGNYHHIHSQRHHLAKTDCLIFFFLITFFKITLLIIFCSLGVIGIYFPPSSSLLIQNSRCSSSYFLPPVTPYISTCIILQHLHLPAWRLCEKMFLQALIYFFLYRFLLFLSLFTLHLPPCCFSFLYPSILPLSAQYQPLWRPVM